MATTTTLSYITTLGETQLAAALGGTKITISQAVFGSDIIINKTQAQLIALTNAVSSGNMSPVYTATGSQIQYNLIGTNQIQFRVTLGSNIGGFSIGNWGLMDSSGNLITITALSDVEVKNATSSTNAGDNRVFSITLTMDQTIISNLDLSVISLGAASLPEEPTETALPTVATSSYPVYHVQDYNSTGYPALASRASGSWHYYLPIEELDNLFVHQGGGVGQTTSNIIYVGWDTGATGLKATVDKTDLGYFAFKSWVSEYYLSFSGGGAITGSTTYNGSEIVNTATMTTALSKKVTNYAGTDGGVYSLDLAGDGSGRLAYASANGWQIVQPAGNYALINSPNFTGTPTCPDIGSSSGGTTIVNYESMKSYVSAEALGYTPVHQGGGIGQGGNIIYIGWATDGSGLKCTVDATDEGVFAFQSWVSDNYQTITNWNYNINQQLLTSSSPTFNAVSTKTVTFNNGGNSSIYQDTNTSDVVIHTNNGTDHYNIFNADGGVSFGPITSTGDIKTGESNWLYTNYIGSYNGTVNVNATLQQQGADVATQSWVTNLGYATTSWVNSQGFATTNWVNSNYVGDNTYSSDFSTSDSRVFNSAYGTRIQGFSVGQVGERAFVTFPQAFGSIQSVVVQSADDADTNVHPYSLSNTGFYLHINGGGTTDISVVAFGGK